MHLKKIKIQKELSTPFQVDAIPRPMTSISGAGFSSTPTTQPVFDPLHAGFLFFFFLQNLNPQTVARQQRARYRFPLVLFQF